VEEARKWLFGFFGSLSSPVDSLLFLSEKNGIEAAQANREQ